MLFKHKDFLKSPGQKLKKYKKSGKCCLNIRIFLKSPEFDQRAKAILPGTCAKT